MTPDVLAAPPASAEELREEIERLRLMHSIGLEFSASLDFDELLPRVFQRVLAALGAQGGSLWITEGDMLRCRLAEGGAGQKLVGAEMPVGTGFVGDVAQRQRTTIVTRAMDDPRYQPQVDSSEMLSTTVMATAMVAGGVTVGAIQISNKLTGPGRYRSRRVAQRPAPHGGKAGPRSRAPAGDQPGDHRYARLGPGASVGG
jgi:signal transduction protein with GAF and PtsI domain